MTDTSRRAFLAGATAGLAGFAGCSGLPGFGDEGTDDQPIDREALQRAVDGDGSLTPPDAFPITVPAAIQERHRERAREYLDQVPSDPSIPNGEVAARIAERRSDASDALAAAATGRPRERLETWRDRRRDAASVRGSYLAATGEVDRSALEANRRDVRSTLATFEGDWTYRATGPVAAAVVHGTFEEYVDGARDRLVPAAAFPDDPRDAVSHVGDLVGDVDAAGAAVGDAGRLRTQYLNERDDVSSYTSVLGATVRQLRRVLSQTTSELEPHVEGDASAFDRDLDETPAETLYQDASRAVEWREEQANRARRRDRPATAVLATGRALASTQVLDAVVGAIRDGRYQSSQTVDDVERATESARDALATAWEATPRSLAVELARPAFLGLRQVDRNVERGYADSTRALSTVTVSEGQARAVPAVTDFVAERLRGTDGS